MKKNLSVRFVFLFVVCIVLLVGTVALVRTTAPASYLYSNGTNKSLSFSYNYTGTIGTTKVNCTLYIDSIKRGTNGTRINKTVTIKANHSIANGTHYWNITCVNRTGTGKQTSNLSKLIIDRFVPAVSLLSPANGLNSSSTSKTFIWNVTDRGSDLTLNCSVKVNGLGSVSGNISVSNNTAWSLDGTYANNLYKWNVTCIDNATNRGITAVRTFRVDTLKPNVSVVVNRTKYNEDTRYNLWINASDANAGIKNCSFFTGSTYLGVTYLGVMSYTVASKTANRSVIFAIPKNYTVVAKCTDTAGNTNNTVRSILVINDTNNPGIISSTASAAALSVIFAINTDDYVNFSIRYGTSTSRAGQNYLVAATTKADNHTYALSGLTENTLYYYNLSVCDLKNRCNVSSSSFTTLNNAGGGSHRSSTTTTETIVPEVIISGITPEVADTSASVTALTGAGTSDTSAQTVKETVTEQKTPTTPIAPVGTQKLSFWEWLKSIFAKIFG